MRKGWLAVWDSNRALAAVSGWAATLDGRLG
jgi:hypothetical protein